MLIKYVELNVGDGTRNSVVFLYDSSFNTTLVATFGHNIAVGILNWNAQTCFSE